MSEQVKDGGETVSRDVLAIGVRARNIEITRQQRAGEPNNEDHALRIGIAAALAAYGLSECQACESDGVHATDGSGPLDCYECGKKAHSSIREPSRDDGVWPNGCRKPNSCARHRACMYSTRGCECRHFDKDLGQAIDSAEFIAAREAKS